MLFHNLFQGRKRGWLKHGQSVLPVRISAARHEEKSCVENFEPSLQRIREELLLIGEPRSQVPLQEEGAKIDTARFTFDDFSFVLRYRLSQFVRDEFDASLIGTFEKVAEGVKVCEACCFVVEFCNQVVRYKPPTATLAS